MINLSLDDSPIEEVLDALAFLMQEVSNKNYQVKILPELLISSSEEIKMLRKELLDAQAKIDRLLGKPENTNPPTKLH